MSPRPAANSGTDNLGNYLILPFFAACWAYFLEYQMRPAVKTRQALGEASAPILLPLSPPPPRAPLTTQTRSRPRKASVGSTQVSERRCAHEGSGDQDDVSCVQLCATPRTVLRQAPLSMEFSRQEYWSGQPLPPPGESF